MGRALLPLRRWSLNVQLDWEQQGGCLTVCKQPVSPQFWRVLIDVMQAARRAQQELFQVVNVITSGLDVFLLLPLFTF